MTSGGCDGLGKTELVSRYVRDFGPYCYDGNVLWIDANNSRKLGSSFLGIANSCRIEITNNTLISEVVYGVYKHFPDSGKRSLFVFANPKSYSAIRRFLPRNSNLGINKPSILISCRDNWSNKTDKKNPLYGKEEQKREEEENFLSNATAVTLKAFDSKDALELAKAVLDIDISDNSTRHK